jgi:hypothetical protein
MQVEQVHKLWVLIIFVTTTTTILVVRIEVVEVGL